MVLNLLFLLIGSISVTGRYTLYYSEIDQNHSPTIDCLYAYLIDAGKETGKRYLRNSHLIPYCRRLDEQQNQINENIIKIISFKELKVNNFFNGLHRSILLKNIK